MPLLKRQFNYKRTTRLLVGLPLCCALFWWANQSANHASSGQAELSARARLPLREQLQLPGRWEKRFVLQRGETFELSANLPVPSALPQHARVGVRWTLV